MVNDGCEEESFDGFLFFSHNLFSHENKKLNLSSFKSPNYPQSIDISFVKVEYCEWNIIYMRSSFNEDFCKVGLDTQINMKNPEFL